jgi:hypothetical protein
VWTVLLPLLASLTQPPDGVPPADSSADRADIIAVLDRMTQAMEKRDTALLTSVFAPGARLVGMRPQDRGTTMQVLTVQQFAEFVANDKRDRWVERLHEPEVRIDGTLATVWAAYDFSFGSRRSHCGTDAFQLLRTAEGWKIVSLADTYRTEGCG